MGEAWFILVLIGVGLVIAYFAWRQQHARRQAMSRLAGELGWVFHDDWVRHDGGDFFSGLLGLGTGGGPDPAYRAFKVFSQGRDRRSYNTLEGAMRLAASGGERACQAIAGDYRYTTGSGKNQSTHHFSYLIVELPGGPVPETIIRPEGFFDQLAGIVGFDDIDFESAQFSKAFHVKGMDKRFAYDLCDPRMMEFLLMSKPGTMEIDRFHFCMADGRKRWSPEEFKHHIGWTVAFFDHWPRHVVDRLHPRPSVELPPSFPPRSADPFAASVVGIWGKRP